MKAIKNRSHGVISVLISLLLIGVLSVGTMVLEAGRYQSAKTQITDATISASTSMIASYDADLYSRYGLLAIDTERFTTERAWDYMNFNSDNGSGYTGNKISKMYDIDSVELTGLYNLTCPDILKRQVLSRAKYHVVPQENALNIDNMYSVFSDFQSKCDFVADNLSSVINGYAFNGSINDVSADMKTSLKALYETYKNYKTSDERYNVTLDSASVGILPSITRTVVSNAPAEDVQDINKELSNATTVLGSTAAILSYNNGTVTNDVDVSVDTSFMASVKDGLKDISSVSNISFEVKSTAINIKNMAQSFNASLNALSSDSESNLLLNSYIANYFSNRNHRISTYAGPDSGVEINGTMSNATFSSACAEYFFGGKTSEVENQKVAYDYLSGIYLINNLYAVMSSSPYFNENNCYSVAAHIAWANYETYVDLELMTKYSVSVPLLKDKAILSIDNPAKVSRAFADKNTANALKLLGYYDGTNFSVPGNNYFSYTDSIAFALWFVPNSEKMLRIADLVQLEMRYREQHVDGESATFLMSNQNTFCRIKCMAEYNTILPIISIDSSANQINDFVMIKYAGY